MTKKMIHLKIDDRSVSVPEGTLVVDAAKQVDINIPVFCYHPKMEPVGICRMCLVDIGRPMVDRATNEIVREADGSPKIQFGPKLDTACTTPVSEGMVVVTDSEKVKNARREVVEFILTSHPLDCPVCDKGGECPLQNLTMAHGPGQSRFLFDDKKHFQKHVPLGELIFLDRERCIQCARCVRFQHEVVDDPVIDFYKRGRSLEIVTRSEPGFDSVFSGNTSDICPVGALTTADFRFGARPWELKQAASICNHCPVGCNLTFNVRREARSDGKQVIKRVMPRQNEAVNEIWLCDKGRFVYQYTESDQRLTRPLLRKNGELQPAEWDEALKAVAENMRVAGQGLVTLASGRLANEDLFNMAQVTQSQGGRAVLYSYMAGGDLVAQVGLGQDSNFGEMGAGSVIVVVASDLHEEAPLWWLRIKQAVKRGATLIVVNPRITRLDSYAKYVLRYEYGSEAAAVSALLPGTQNEVYASWAEAAQAAATAENLVVLYGSEGLHLAQSQQLAELCASLLVKTNHTGRPNNGLVGVWPHGNTQGAWDLGFSPLENQVETLGQAHLLWVAGCDPAGDDKRLAEAVDQAVFVVVQELFLTETARRADVVLPVQAFTEREGTYTSGERRVQRFYPAVTARPGTLADFAIAARVGRLLGLKVEDRAASLVFDRLAESRPDYAGLMYPKLAEVVPQSPAMSRSDLYYGGTTYENLQGQGVQLSPLLQNLEKLAEVQATAGDATNIPGKPLLVPVSRLYDQGSLMQYAELLKARLARPVLKMHPQTLAQNQVSLSSGELALAGEGGKLVVGGQEFDVSVEYDETLPVDVILVPRSVGIPVK
jgi:NADH-quinone oxidoreductase subunit G